MSYQEIVDDRKSQVAEGTDAPAQATDPISTEVQSSIQNDANNQQPQPEIPVNALRVLITGFGPFLHHEVNPSWLAVKPLHNAILYTQPANAPLQLPEASSQSRQSKSKGKGSDDGQSSDKGSSKSPAKATTTPSNVEEFIFSTEPRPIHITTVCIPVVYESVLEIVPGLHARPPNIPAKLFAVEGLPMPESLPQAFDFMFHVGVAGRGPLRMERLGHKFGYHMKDASGRYAQVVKVQSKDFSRQNAAMPGVAPPVPGSPGGMSASGSNNWQAGSLHGGLAQNPNFGEGGSGGVGFGESSGDIFARPTRGFGLPYEAFPEEITTDVDVTRLVYDLKQNGVEVSVLSCYPLCARRHNRRHQDGIIIAIIFCLIYAVSHSLASNASNLIFTPVLHTSKSTPRWMRVITSATSSITVRLLRRSAPRKLKLNSGIQSAPSQDQLTPLIARHTHRHLWEVIPLIIPITLALHFTALTLRLARPQVMALSAHSAQLKSSSCIVPPSTSH